jgi:hypothetical protein
MGVAFLALRVLDGGGSGSKNRSGALAEVKQACSTVTG